MHVHRIWAALAASLLLAVSGCFGPAPTSGDNPDHDPGTTEAPPVDGELVDWPMFNGRLEGWNFHPEAQLPYCKASRPSAWEECVVAEWKFYDINQGSHGAAKSSAVLYDETIYVGADTGLLWAFHPNGTALWNASTEPSKNGIHGTPLVQGDLVYIGAYDGAVYAFDRYNGERVWRTEVGSWIGSSPRYHDGEIYIAVEHGGSTSVGGTGRSSAWGDLQILDAATGERVWRSEELGSHPHSTVAISPEDDVFVVGANDERVYAWDLGDRALRWSFLADGPGDEGDVKGPIMIYDGAAFFGSWDHRYYRVDLETGEEDWHFEADHWIMTGSAVDPETDTVYFGSNDHHVYALDATTGELRWRHEMGAHLIGSPTLTSDMLLFGASDYGMHAFDKDTGERLWSYPTLHRVSAAPLIVGDRIVFADRSECGPIVEGECEWGGSHGILYSLAPAP